MIDALIGADPAYLRVTTASNQCPRDPHEPCATGLPDPSLMSTPEFQRLAHSGIKLGVGINATYGQSRGRLRPPREVIDQACRIRAADPSGFYDFIFLDFPLRRGSPAGLQRMIDRIRDGRNCPPGVGGWKLVMTSETVFGSRDAVGSPRGVWAHAKRLELLSARDWRERAAQAARGRRPAVIAKDRAFVGSVTQTRTRGHAVLDLEVPHQAAQFATLPHREQAGLLRRWARAQAREGFHLVYPLYVSGLWARVRQYDARAEGTLGLETRLMCRYDGPSRGEC